MFFTQNYKNHICAKNCIYAKNYIPFFIYNVFYKHFSSHFFFLYMHKNLHTKNDKQISLYTFFFYGCFLCIFLFLYVLFYIYKFFYFFFLIYVLINIFLYIHYLINDSRHIQSFSLYAFL